MEQEFWKPVIGVKDNLYDGYYEVSNLGRFKMLPRLLRHSKGIRVSKEKIVEVASLGMQRFSPEASVRKKMNPYVKSMNG